MYNDDRENITNNAFNIRTNYKAHRNKIKRPKSKPCISRRNNNFNYEQNINDIKNNLKNDIYNNHYYKNKENYSIFWQNDDSSNQIEQQSSKMSKFSNQKFYPNTKRVLDTNFQDAPKNQKHINNDNTPKDDWAEMLYHPSDNSAYPRNEKINNSKTFQSHVFPNPNEPIEKIRHYRQTKFSDRLHKTQITTLPGCIKRGKYDIKDDQNFSMRNSESYLYKMEHDFSSNVHFGPLSKEEQQIENYFPTEQRYQGSYQRWNRDNDIFNFKKYSNKQEEEEKVNNYHGKKLFKNNKTFQSQIKLI